MLKIVMLAAAGVGTLVAAGCSSSNPSPASHASGGRASTTVAIQNVSGVGNVLVDRAGHTLYESTQEKSGKVLCSSSACTAIWVPLTVSAGQKPTGPSSLSGKLATVSRAGGKAQVTLNGAPLYTFSFDRASGEDKGNGQSDSFDGTSFSWHAATPTGAAAAPATTSNGGGGYGGGYG